ncbi:hypothetical protein C8R48DRAFT_676818 [Suillus tomentosus]|nr:hypothetical protein C8R48DRAFT_676818 [Suillus tomentosus]
MTCSAAASSAFTLKRMLHVQDADSPFPYVLNAAQNSTSTFQQVAFPASIKLPAQKATASKAVFQTTRPTFPVVLSTRAVDPRRAQGKGGVRREMDPSAWVTVMAANVDHERNQTQMRGKEDWTEFQTLTSMGVSDYYVIGSPVRSTYERERVSLKSSFRASRLKHDVSKKEHLHIGKLGEEEQMNKEFAKEYLNSQLPTKSSPAYLRLVHPRIDKATGSRHFFDAFHVTIIGTLEARSVKVKGGLLNK